MINYFPDSFEFKNHYWIYDDDNLDTESRLRIYKCKVCNISFWFYHVETINIEYNKLLEKEMISCEEYIIKNILK